MTAGHCVQGLIPRLNESYRADVLIRAGAVSESRGFVFTFTHKDTFEVGGFKMLVWIHTTTQTDSPNERTLAEQLLYSARYNNNKYFYLFQVTQGHLRRIKA